MKKKVKCVVLSIAAIFLLLIGAGLFYYFPMFLMTPAETGQIPDSNIYTIKDIGSNVYFVTTDNGYIMIDAGMNIKNIENSLREAGINASEVKWIFLTHSDGDHVASLTLFSNANIYMSKDELPLINGTRKRFFLGGNKMPSGVTLENIMLLSTGQELLLNGTKIECILAPGHTIGSMLYLIDDKYLFSGDAFKIKNENMTVHPYSMDANLSKNTIEQAKKIINSNHVILTSHYGLHYGN